MARPIKNGVDYFPKDTDYYMNDKVRILRAEFGFKGMYILDYLLCEVYRLNGYYLPWDSTRCLLLLDGIGAECTSEYLEKFIEGCLRCAFFDRRVYEEHHVLTSAGIQRRYMRMINKRDSVSIVEEYWLLDASNAGDVPPKIQDKIKFTRVSGTDNPVSGTDNAQRKEKKRKEKESKVNQSKEIAVPAELVEDWSAYVQMREKMRKPLSDYAMELALLNLEDLAPGDRQAQQKILQQSVMNGWQGLFPLRRETKPPEADWPPRSYDIDEMEQRLLHGPIVYKKNTA